MLTVIQKWGNSQGIRIPKSMLDQLSWEKNQEVDVKCADGKIIIEPEKKRKNINQLFSDYDGTYEAIDIDWGSPAGEEIW